MRPQFLLNFVRGTDNLSLMLHSKISLPKLSLIVAMARNRTIGRGNDLPWHIPEDLKRFKALTTGKPVILGRKTFDSIVGRLGKPLPNRPHFVVTRGMDNIWENVTTHGDLQAAIAAARAAYPQDDIAIIGGASIYALALPLVDTMYLTIVDADIEGDAHFPDFPMLDWVETARERVETSSIPFETVTLTRRV